MLEAQPPAATLRTEIESLPTREPETIGLQRAGLIDGALIGGGGRGDGNGRHGLTGKAEQHAGSQSGGHRAAPPVRTAAGRGLLGRAAGAQAHSGRCRRFIPTVKTERHSGLRRERLALMQANSLSSFG